MKILILAWLMLAGLSAQAFQGTWQNNSVLNRQVTDVKLYLFDAAKTGQCSDSQCFRLDVYVNGQHFARWPASPGKKHWGTKFVGVYTPEFGSAGRPLHSGEIYYSYTNKHGDSMPFAMFLRTAKGNKSGIALHAGHVTGRRESHGCIRLLYDDAKTLNSLVREAFKNGGRPHIWTKHTLP